MILNYIKVILEPIICYFEWLFKNNINIYRLLGYRRAPFELMNRYIHPHLQIKRDLGFGLGRDIILV